MCVKILIFIIEDYIGMEYKSLLHNGVSFKNFHATSVVLKLEGFLTKVY